MSHVRAAALRDRSPGTEVQQGRHGARVAGWLAELLHFGGRNWESKWVAHLAPCRPSRVG